MKENFNIRKARPNQPAAQIYILFEVYILQTGW